MGKSKRSSPSATASAVATAAAAGLLFCASFASSSRENPVGRPVFAPAFFAHAADEPPPNPTARRLSRPGRSRTSKVPKDMERNIMRAKKKKIKVMVNRNGGGEEHAKKKKKKRMTGNNKKKKKKKKKKHGNGGNTGDGDGDSDAISPPTVEETPSPSAYPSTSPTAQPTSSPSSSLSSSPSTRPTSTPNSDDNNGDDSDGDAAEDLDYALTFDLSPHNPRIVTSSAKPGRDAAVAPPGTGATLYGTKDPVTGLVQSVTHAEAITVDGQDGSLRRWTVTWEDGGTGRPATIWAESGEAVMFEYDEDGRFATFTFVPASSGDAQEKVTVELPIVEGGDRRGRGLTGETGMVQKGEGSSATVEDGESGEDGQAEAPRPPVRDPKERGLADGPGKKIITVSVISCDEFGIPVDMDGVDVFMDVKEYRGGALSSSYKVRGVPMGPGEFQVPITLPTAEVVPSSPDTLCQQIGTAVGLVCSAVNGQTLVSAALICAQLRLPWAFLLCEAAFAAVLFTCATIGAGSGFGQPGSGAPRLFSLICSETEIELGYDSIYMVPTARVPGLPASEGGVAGGAAEGEGAPYSGSPFSIPDGFFVDVANLPDFVSIEVSVNPVAGQDYTVDAVTMCLPLESAVALSVSGADGYADTVSCAADPQAGLGKQSCSMTVPGADAYVKDTLEASIDGTGKKGKGQLFFRPRTDGSFVPRTARTEGGPSDPDLSIIWTKRGQGISLYGNQHPDDNFVGLDYRIDLSDDGNTLAVGAPHFDATGSENKLVYNAGFVGVLRYDGSAWVPLRAIRGSAPHETFGFQVSLSKGLDPLTGVPTTFLAASGQGGSFHGSIQVFYLTSSSSWEPFGPKIEGNENIPRIGETLSLANGGRTVATGSATHKIDGWQRVGCILVYDYTNVGGQGQWLPRGSPCEQMRGDVESDFLGRHVSLSSDGNVVAAMADNAFARAYRWNGSETGWVPMGQKLELSSSGGHWFVSRSVSLSMDGTILAARGGRALPNGYLRVFQYDSVSDKWLRLGQDIWNDGGAVAVGLSADGTTLCEGGSFYDGADDGAVNAGRVRMFRLIDGHWVQQGYEIDGEGMWYNFGEHCSISADGNVVVGAGSIEYGGVNVFQAEEL